jgi:hypothetical protein
MLRATYGDIALVRIRLLARPGALSLSPKREWTSVLASRRKRGSHPPCANPGNTYAALSLGGMSLLALGGRS